MATTFSSPTETNRSFGSRNPNKQSSTSTFNLQHTQCQICNKFGISALNCWYHYESSPSTINANTFTQDNKKASILGTPSTLHDPLSYPDSGATHHLTPDALNHKTPYTGSKMVKIGNNTSLSIKNIGFATYTTPNFSTKFSLTHLLHVPSISKNLLSVSKFARDNHVFFEFHADHCLVKHQKTKQTLLHGKVKDGLYVFQDFIPTNKLSVNTSSVAPNIDLYTLWHKRFGHANSNVIHRIMKQCNLHIPAKQQFCDTCVISKAHQLPFTDSVTVYTSPLELVFIDIWGTSPVPSSSGARYYIAFLDAYTRYVWLYLIQNKSQVITIFKSFKLYSEKTNWFSNKEYSN